MRRIRAARAANRFPRIYTMLERGRISLSTVALLQSHLCRENYSRLLDQAAGKNRYEVDRLIASLAPKREPVERIRHLGPTTKPQGANAPQSELLPVGEPEMQLQESARKAFPTRPTPSRRVHFSFTADESLLTKIRRARELLSHKYPTGRLEQILEAAMEALLEMRDPERRIARKLRRAAQMRKGPGLSRLR